MDYINLLDKEYLINIINVRNDYFNELKKGT
jgi:hypothetical protein